MLAVAVHGVNDLEAFVEQAMRRKLAAIGARLDPDQLQDMHAFLVEHAWRLAVSYDPSRGTQYGTWAYALLQLRVSNWFHHTFGRDGHKREQVSLDDAGLDEAECFGSADAEADCLARGSGLLGE